MNVLTPALGQGVGYSEWYVQQSKCSNVSTTTLPAPRPRRMGRGGWWGWGGEGGGGERRAVVGPLALAEALAALLRERVGALVHPVALVCADVPEAHVDALAS